jgi:hypothetical protein
VPATTAGEAPAKTETRVALAGDAATSADTSASPMPVERPLRAGPVSVFVSRKEQKVYVRKGFEPLFDMPVTIQNADQPLGTHLFVAMSPKEGGSEPRWMVVSPPPKESGVVTAVQREHSTGKHSKKRAETPAAPAAQSPAAAAAALDRIQLPDEAVQRISALMAVGAALTITDEGLGPETGKETDFTVVTSQIRPTKRPSSERSDRYERYDRPDRYQYYPPRRWF